MDSLSYIRMKDFLKCNGSTGEKRAKRGEYKCAQDDFDREYRKRKRQFQRQQQF